MLILGLPVMASQLHGIYLNNQGVQRFTKKRPVEAFDRFNNALADLPFSPEVHYNLGTAFLENKEYEKALSEYQQSMTLVRGQSKRELEVRFKALFNSAIALTELKRVDEAIDHYQKALEIIPDSVEVKTNIELLVQQDGGGSGGEKDDKDQKNKDSKGQKDPKDKNKDGDGDNKDQKDKPKPDQSKEPPPKPSPRPFKSEELSQQDVGRILEELKRQEDQIRAKMQREGAKDAPLDKDW